MHNKARTSRYFIWWWNNVLNAWYYYLNKTTLEGEIKDAKMSSFLCDFQTFIKHLFPLYSSWSINEIEKEKAKKVWENLTPKSIFI